jgi:hypothetical protein
MLDANAGEAEETLETEYKKWRPLHRSATALFLVGIVAMGYVLWAPVG